MARLKNPNSVRQRAFTMLDTLTGVKRDKVLIMLKDTFNIGDSYAMSLHAAHRTINKNNGTMKKSYMVCDVKAGKEVLPFIKEINSFTPPSNSAGSITTAKELYIKTLYDKMVLVKKL